MKAQDVKPGHVISYTNYVKVKYNHKNTLYGDVIGVEDLDNGTLFDIKGTELIEQGDSADVYEKTEVVNKTELARLLSTSYGKPFTVCFLKADKSQRVLRGRLVGTESLLGRSQVEDLDLEKGNNFRLVCHRTLQWLVLDGVKYVLKK